MHKLGNLIISLVLCMLLGVSHCYAAGIPATQSELVKTIIFGILILAMLFSMAFNVSWWMYGKTLSEAYPTAVVILMMFTNLIGFFLAFKFLFGAIFNNVFPSHWGYTTEYEKFVPYSKDITHYVSGILTVGMAILLYKDEGKITGGKWDDSEYRK